MKRDAPSFSLSCVRHAIAIGEGDYFHGKLVLEEVAEQLGQARAAQSWANISRLCAYTEISNKCCEFGEAIMRGDLEDQHEKALALAADVIRFLLREWEPNSSRLLQ